MSTEKKQLPSFEEIKNLFEKLYLLEYEGEDFNGFYVEGNKIGLRSSTFYSGCGEELFYDEYLIWDILNLNVEEIHKKRNLAIQAEKERLAEDAARKAKEKEIREEEEERELFAELYKKYGLEE